MLELKNQIISVLDVIYKETDTLMKNIPSVCSKGCSFCCNQNIMVFKAEELMMTKFMNKYFEMKTKEIVKNNILNWYKYFDENTPHKPLLPNDIKAFTLKLFNDRISCPFLIDNKCSIYAARPIVCRTHSVNQYPEECDKDIKRNSSIESIQVQSIMINKIRSLIPNHPLNPNILVPIVYAVREYFSINFNFKPIAILNHF